MTRPSSRKIRATYRSSLHIVAILLLLACGLAGCATNTQPAPGMEQNEKASTEKAALGENPKQGTAAYGAGFLSSLDEDDEFLESPELTRTIADPLEPWNRFWHNVNDLGITYVATPVRDGYVMIVPKPLREGVGNFFHNLLFPVRFVNNILQGKPKVAAAELGSFLLDSTFGFAGLVNVSHQLRADYIPDDEDTGQTLGVWGIGEGIYLVWPLLGPSNLRDSIGMVGDTFLDPLTYLEPFELSLALSTVRTVNNLDATITTYENMKKIAVEPYSAVRDGFTQYRRAKIAK